MYKILFTLCVSFSFIAQSQNLNFTDSKFKALIVNSTPSNEIAKDLNGNPMAVDSNGDGEIQISEAQQVKILNIKSIGIPAFNNLPGSVADALLFQNLEELYIRDSKSAVINFTNNNVIKKVLYEGSGGFIDNSGMSHIVSIDFSFNNCSSVKDVNDFVANINLAPYDPATILRFKTCPQIKDDIILNNKNIKELHIESCNIKTLTFTSCNRLDKIIVPNINSLTKISVLGSNGITLTNTNQDINLVANNCTNLQEIIADTDHYDTTGAYFTSVNLNGCSSLKKIKGLNVPTIDFSNTGLINLEELDASFYNRYGYNTTSGVYFGNVTSLNLSGLPHLKLLKVFNQPITNTVNFSDATALENIDITNSSGYMAILNVSNLSNLNTLKADIPNDLNSSNTHFDLQQIMAQNCTALTNLSINGNRDLKSLNLQNCSSIQTLNLGSNLPGNSPFDNFSELNTLNINQCTALRDLGLTYTKVPNLELSQCPQLESIDFEYNSSLASINTSQNSMLKYVTLRSCPLVTNLDFSNSSILEGVGFYNMSGLTHVNIKNSSLEGCEFFGYGSNLTICVDPDQLTNLEAEYPDISFTTNCPNTIKTQSSKLDNMITNTNIFPNPVKDTFQIKSSDLVKNVKIVDGLGRLLLDRNFNKKVFKIDISNYTKGIYIVKIKTEKTEISKKILKD